MLSSDQDILSLSEMLNEAVFWGFFLIKIQRFMARFQDHIFIIALFTGRGKNTQICVYEIFTFCGCYGLKCYPVLIASRLFQRLHLKILKPVFCVLCLHSAPFCLCGPQWVMRLLALALHPFSSLLTDPVNKDLLPPEWLDLLSCSSWDQLVRVVKFKL